MKNLNESSAEEEPNANGAFNRSIARSIQPVLVRAKTNGFEREREYTRVSLLSVPFLNFYMKRDEEGFTRKEEGGVGFLFFSSFSTYKTSPFHT